MIRLEGTITGQAQVLGLLLSQLGQLHIQLSQVGFSHCFIQLERNTGRCRISVLLWDPLPQPATHRDKNYSVEVSVIYVTHITSFYPHSQPHWMCCFWLPSSPSSRGSHATYPLQVALVRPSTTSPSSPSTNPSNYHTLLWNLSMNRTYFL